MSNKYQMPANHPIAAIGSILILVGLILFFSDFFLWRPDVSQSHEEFRRSMDRSSMRAFSGVGLTILGSAVRAIAEWTWDNNQPVRSISVRVVSKWTTTYRSRRHSYFKSFPHFYDEYTNYHGAVRLR